jgi:Tfp pilus assembly protein PilF
MAFLALQYSILGQQQRSADLYRKAIATDPLRPDWYYDLSYVLTAQGHLDQAEQAIRKTIALQADYPGAHLQLVTIDILHGDAAAAQRDADKETDPDSKAIALALAQQIGGGTQAADAALHDYIAKYGKTWPYYVADLYALRKQPDEMFQWLQRVRAANGSVLATNLLTDPLVLRYKNDPRFAALCRQLGLPAPGQPLPATASTP